MKNILISDVTLAEINKKGGHSLSFKEKLEIAKKLSELGVDVIEVSPVFDKADDVLIKTICACVTKSTIACYVGDSEEYVEKSFALVKSATKKRLVVSVPVSPVQMEYYLKKKPKAVLEHLGVLVKKAVSLHNDVELVLDDATRAEPSFLVQVISLGLSLGVTTITLNDLEGAKMPQVYCDFIKGLYASVDGLKDVNLAVSVNNGLSMSVASLLSSFDCGVTEIKLSALGVSDYPTVEALIKAMDCLSIKQGYTNNLKKTELSRIIRQIEQISAKKSGKTVFDNITTEENAELLENLTVETLSEIIKNRGYDLSLEDIDKVYAEVKRLSERKAVNTKELDAVIASTALQVPATYTLNKFSVLSSNVLSATASVVLNKGDKELSGLSYGNGSVDAAFLAIENITGVHYDLDGFELDSITEGNEAMGQALVILRNDGKLYSGRGISTDIVGASIRAYVNALNKIVYENK